MDLLIEHNSFQCVGKCLSSSAKEPNDINDFLQICIQTIFTDTLYLSNYVPTSIKDISLAGAQKLKEIGLDNIGLANDDDRSLWDKVCEKTSVQLCSDFKKLASSTSGKGLASRIWERAASVVTKGGAEVSIEEVEKSKNRLPALPPQLQQVVMNITKAINEGNGNAFIDVLSGISQGEKSDALIEILLKKEELFEWTMRFKNKWNVLLTLKIMNDSRVYQNKAIAGFQNLFYAPSVKRIGEEEMQYAELLKKFDDILKVYGRKRYNGILLPSIREYLIEQSKGQPAKLLDETLSLRSKAEPIRLFLNDNRPGLFSDSAEQRDAILWQLGKISEEMLQFPPTTAKSKKPVVGLQHDLTPYFGNLDGLDNTMMSPYYSPQYNCFTEIAHSLYVSKTATKSLTKHEATLHQKALDK